MSDEFGVDSLESPISRSELLKRAGVGVGGLVIAGSVPASALARVVNETAPEANTIKIGFISPRSGALAGFGEPDPYVLGLARKAFAKGITISGKRYAVKNHRQRHAIGSGSRRSARQAADQRRQGRPHADDVDS